MLVQMELTRIIISEINDQQVIYLQEVGGDRMFPILIGIFEATSIDRRVKGEIPPRPLTHDLLKNAILELGGFGVDVASKREAYLEATEQICNMMAMDPYPGFEGKYFSMPCRNVVPKPVQGPHPRRERSPPTRDSRRSI